MPRPVSAGHLRQLNEAVQHLAQARPEPIDADRLAVAVRAACALLAARHPGREVELRVPPLAAVQIGSGERGAHTRGTPPNLAETDPETLLRLAAGLTTWAEAVAGGKVRASGIRSDLSWLWPLPELTAEVP